MFSLSDNLQYYLCTGATDMRKGFDTLCGVVRSEMGCDPLSGEVFIFVNRQRGTVKLLHWESGGLVLYHKRLESGRFERPTYDHEQSAYRMKWSELVMMYAFGEPRICSNMIRDYLALFNFQYSFVVVL